MPFQLRLIKSNDEFRQLQKVWDNLLSQSPADNYFLSWEWLWNWWQVFARPEDRLAILWIENETEVVAIAPFYIRKRLNRGIYPVRRMMFLGTQDGGSGDVCSDYMNIIYRKDEEELVGVIFNALIRPGICEEVFLAKVDNSSSTFNLFHDCARRNGFLTIIANEHVSPYIRLPLSWGDYLGSLSQSMRYKIMRERRKLDKLGNFAVSTAKNTHDLMNYYGELVGLHEKRWGSRGIKGAFSNEQFDRFHRGIMPVMLQNGRLALNRLSENGSPRAVIYNIVYKNKVYFYQCGVDTSENKMAFGYAMHANCIEDAIRNGMSEYDFLPKSGTDNYKDHFANQTRTLSDIYIARQTALKYFIWAEEATRLICRHIKPYLPRVK